MERITDSILNGPRAGDNVPDPLKITPVATTQQILDARRVIGQVYVDERIKDYIISLVVATRDPA